VEELEELEELEEILKNSMPIERRTHKDLVREVGVMVLSTRSNRNSQQPNES
jgi:hypothetical protein